MVKEFVLILSHEIFFKRIYFHVCRAFHENKCLRYLLFGASDSRYPWLHQCWCSKSLVDWTSTDTVRGRSEMVHNMAYLVRKFDEWQFCICAFRTCMIPVVVCSTSWVVFLIFKCGSLMKMTKNLDITSPKKNFNLNPDKIRIFIADCNKFQCSLKKWIFSAQMKSLRCSVY